MTELVRPTHLLDELARNGLHLSNGKTVTYNGMLAIGRALSVDHSDVRLAMGDWLLLVEARWPEKFSQAAEELNINEEARLEYMRTARGIPRSMRREDKRIQYSHYRALAGLKMVDEGTGEVLPDRAKQREVLDMMEQSPTRISHHSLRDMLRPEPNGKVEQPAVCPQCRRPL